jgi:hypothetical protein
MAAFTQKVRERNERVVWLDYVDYAGRLLAGGAVPWLDTASLVGWVRKAQGLLRSDVVTIPVHSFVVAWLVENRALVAEMAAKSRAVYPVKTLLAEESMREALVTLAGAMRTGAAGSALALSLPSPRAWVSAAYRLAHGKDVEAGEEEADSAALYIADFIRSFGAVGIDVLELVETESSEPASVDETECYRAVCNVAGHYRWDVGLRVPGMRHDGRAGAFDFVTSPRQVEGAVHGQSVSPRFWSGTAAPSPAPASFWHATIPADSAPEAVLERLALLR